MSHVSHLAPTFVVVVWSIWIASIVRALAVKFGVVWVVYVVLDLTLQSAHVLSVNLEGESPEGTFPDHTCLSVLNSEVILVVAGLGTNCEVEVGDIEPESDHKGTTDN